MKKKFSCSCPTHGSAECEQACWIIESALCDDAENLAIIHDAAHGRKFLQQQQEVVPGLKTLEDNFILLPEHLHKIHSINSVLLGHVLQTSTVYSFSSSSQYGLVAVQVISTTVCVFACVCRGQNLFKKASPPIHLLSTLPPAGEMRVLHVTL